MNLQHELKSKLSPGRHLLAVSGGADSMALLEAAHQLNRSDKTYFFEVAHVNHNLRKASKDDARFVEDETKKREMRIHFAELKDPPSSNIEEWARKERYKFFLSIINGNELNAVITAHTLNDVVETFLMRLVANKEPRLILAKDNSRKVLRPFLHVNRDEILEFINASGIPFLKDESNDDDRFLRNRVRNKLIPFLQETFDGDPLEIFSKRADAVGEDIEYFDDVVVELMKHISSVFGTREWLKEIKAMMQPLPAALQWRFTEEILKPLFGFRIGRNWGHRVALFLTTDQVGIELPGGFALRKKNGGISVDPSP